MPFQCNLSLGSSWWICLELLVSAGFVQDQCKFLCFLLAVILFKDISVGFTCPLCAKVSSYFIILSLVIMQGFMLLTLLDQNNPNTILRRMLMNTFTFDLMVLNTNQLAIPYNRVVLTHVLNTLCKFRLDICKLFIQLRMPFDQVQHCSLIPFKFLCFSCKPNFLCNRKQKVSEKFCKSSSWSERIHIISLLFQLISIIK